MGYSIIDKDNNILTLEDSKVREVGIDRINIEKVLSTIFNADTKTPTYQDFCEMHYPKIQGDIKDYINKMTEQVIDVCNNIKRQFNNTSYDDIRKVIYLSSLVSIEWVCEKSEQSPVWCQRIIDFNNIIKRIIKNIKK